MIQVLGGVDPRRFWAFSLGRAALADDGFYDPAVGSLDSWPGAVLHPPRADRGPDGDADIEALHQASRDQPEMKGMGGPKPVGSMTLVVPRVPLTLAIGANSLECTRLLLDAGCDPNAGNMGYASPFFCALSSSVGDRDKKIAIVRLLVEAYCRAVGEDEALAAGVIVGERADTVHTRRMDRVRVRRQRRRVLCARTCEQGEAGARGLEAAGVGPFDVCGDWQRRSAALLERGDGGVAVLDSRSRGHIAVLWTHAVP